MSYWESCQASLPMGSILTLQNTISEQLSAYLIYFIRQQSASALVGYQCHTLTAVTDQPEAPKSRCADLHCIASGVPFPSLLLKVVQHSSPGNYLSIAQKSKDVNSVTLTSNVFVQLKKHLTWVSFQIISFSLPSHPATSSCNPYLYPHASLKLNQHLLGSSCLYTAKPG